MSDVLLIARREFLQYIRTRGFLLTLFFIPAWFVLGGVLQHIASETKTVRYFAVVDQTGHYSSMIDRALAADTQRRELAAFAAWVDANADVDALSAQQPDLADLLNADGADPGMLARFAAAGGASGLMTKIHPFLRANAVEFHAPAPNLGRVELTPDLVAAAEGKDRARLHALFAGETTIAGSSGATPLFALAVIPAEFSIDSPYIEYWGENMNDPAVQDFLHRTLVDALRLQTVDSANLDPAIVHKLLDSNVRLRRFNPLVAAGNGIVTKGDILRVFLPFAAALLLLVAILSISSMLLMAVIEEKSSRVIELILASTSPYRLMAGKLIGAAGAAVILMAGWILGAGGALSLLTHSPPGEAVDLLSKAHAFDDLPAMALCFACGMAIHSTIFLGVGAMARTFQEAQSYLGPLLFLLFAPLGFVSFVYKDPNGTIATLLSFSPLHAPFFLMMRLPNNPPPISTLFAFIWMVFCTAIILRLMVLGFVRHILPSERAALLPGGIRRLWRKSPPAA